MSPQLKPIAVLVTVFVLGGVSGAGVTHLAATRHLRATVEGPPGEARMRMRLAAMQRRLDLDDDQVQRINTILREGEAERDRRMAACHPAIEEIRGETDAKILEVLRPEQRAAYESLDRAGGRHRGPPGPPRH